ncbi:MAG: acetylglutamate kinase [Planctomycetales bacterium]|nr:acetylglutamate kinase [Planctomycetales bacterium]
MEEAIQKADILIEALGWIRRLKDRTVVIKLGGSIMNSEDALRHVLLDIVFMSTVGMRPVIVHGGGAKISEAMSEAGIVPRFVHGRRYTDDETLEIVKRVLGGEINRWLGEQIELLGGRAMTLNCEGGPENVVLHGERLTLDSPDGPLDLGRVGTVTSVDRPIIENLCYSGQVPVIPSICLDAEGGYLNVNADTAATAVARELRVDKLVFLSDVNGVRRDKDDPDSLIHTVTASEAQRLIDDRIVSEGMIPKVEACLETLRAGVHKVHIIDGRIRHSLLLEIYTSTGIGTQIVQDPVATS